MADCFEFILWLFESDHIFTAIIVGVIVFIMLLNGVDFD